MQTDYHPPPPHLGSGWPSPRLCFHHLEAEEEFKKGRKTFVPGASVWSRISLGFDITSNSPFFHLFVELILCTALREQRNHKDMHKLSHKKEGEREFHF